LVFGDGTLTACKPISDRDLAAYLADCLDDESRWNRVLPIGGPGDAITPRQQGEQLFALLGQAPRFRHVPVALLSIIAAVLSALGRVVPALAAKAELARMGRYYATESMLVLNQQTQRHDAEATPSTGRDTLFYFYATVVGGRAYRSAATTRFFEAGRKMMDMSSKGNDRGGSRLDSFKAHPLPVVKATRDSLQGYGSIVTDYESAQVDITTWPALGWRPIDDGTGNEGGIVEGIYDVWWEGSVLLGRNHAVNDEYLFGWSRDPNSLSDETVDEQPAELLFWHVNYHPDGGQIFFPTERKPFVVPLALAGDDVKPEDFVAFYFDGSCGVHVDAGVWHEAPFPLTGASSFKDKQGAVHARVSCDFVKEFGVYCQIPLREL